MRVKGNIILLLFSITLLFSCQTVEKSKGPLLAVEEMSLKKKIEEWEGYIRFIEHKDVSIETLLRLTEGYLEAKEILYKKDVEEYEKSIALYNKGSLQEEPQRPKQDYSSLINHFTVLTEKYPYRDKTDKIYYMLGYTLYEQGDRDEAVKAFEELVRNYPWSAYFIEVSFRLGEFYFETGQMGEALEAYNRVLNSPDSIFYNKAIYKLGWVYYKLDEFKKAAQAFMVIVDKAWEDKSMESGLAEDAISGIVMTLNHFKNTDDIIGYLLSGGLKGYMPLVLGRLWDLFVEEARYNSAISIHNALIELFPDAPNLPFIYEKMAGLYDLMGDKKSAAMTRLAMVYQYNPTTTWYKKNYPAGSKTVDALVSKTMLSISKGYRLVGKKENDLEKLRYAIKSYQDFLVFFQNSPDYKKINLLLAETFFDMGRYQEAAQEYEKTVLLYPEGQERGEIAYSLFLTYEVIFNQSEETREKTVISVRQVLENYKSDFLNSGRLEKVLYRVADMYSLIGELDKARELLLPIAKSKNPVPAYKKIAELYLAEGELTAAVGIYERLLDISDDITFKERLAALHYKIAEDYLKAERYEDAALKFKEAFRIHPGSQVGEAALMRLGYIHIQRKELDNLRDVVKRIMGVYPDSDGAVSLLVKAGQELEKTGQPIKAAEIFEDASAISKDAADISKLIFASAMLYERNGKKDKAKNLFERYILSDEIPIENEAQARYILGRIQLEKGRKQEGIKILVPLMEWKGKIDDRLVARASLLILKERQENYLKIKLTPPFEETLQKKTLLLDTLLKGYSDVARYRIPELLPECFYQMGMILENFRDSLINSERPQDLTQEEIEEYYSLLKEKAFPYDDEAVNAYEKSVLAGRKHTIAVEKSLERLADLRPLLYRREFEKKWIEPIFIYPEVVTLEE